MGFTAKVVMNFTDLYSFIKHLGIFHGITLYIKIKFRNLGAIKIKGIQFPFSLRPYTSDLRTFDQIFLDKQYDIDINFTPMIIVDAGANVGLFSILYKNKFPNAKIACIEPDPENYLALENNLKQYKDIILYKAALWPNSENLKIDDKYKLGKWGMIVSPNEGNESAGVQGITPGQIISENNIDIIDIFKIDIETAEMELFGKGDVSWLKKVRVVVIELHDWLKPGCAYVFFKSINAVWSSYTFSTKGDLVIVRNMDLD